jgi:uncharacterized protein YndB with AHSA1/START domain
MSNPTSVDSSAPVLAHHEADIDAPLERIWRLHVDVNAWPRWQTDITQARLDGSFAVGKSFEWTSYGFTVTSTIYAIDDGSRILWGGTADGITGVHEWLFTETSSGTRVTTNESFAGEPVEADAVGMQSLLDASLAAWLGHLKAAAEGSA